MLSEPHIQRFSRHVLLREVGGIGQERLLSARVAVPRLDEAGRACALWLARAGVGTIILPLDVNAVVTADALLLASDVGRPLTEAVRERLLEHFPDLAFDGAPTHTAPESGWAEGALAVMRDVVRGRP